MEFRVATKVYRLVVVVEPIVHNGANCDALAQTHGRLIRMAAHVPAADRFNTLLHELRHCWGFHVPKPSTEEEEADLVGMLTEAAVEDLESQGGIRELMRLKPVAVSDAVAVAVDDAVAEMFRVPVPPTGYDRLDTLRQAKFRHLSDLQWAGVLDDCRWYGIDPAACWPKAEVNQETGEEEVRLILTYGNLVTIARRTGRLVGLPSAPEYLLPDGTWTPYWTHPDPPAVARSFVTRSDMPEPIPGIVELSRSMRFVKVPGTDDQYEPARGWGPGQEAGQLGKCAKAKAIRDAFQEELGRLSTRDEDAPRTFPRPNPRPPTHDDGQAEPRKAAASRPKYGGTPTMSSLAAAMLDPPDDPQWAARFINDGTPDSRRGLLLELVNRRDYGMADAAALIDKAGEKFKKTMGASYQAFAAAVLKTTPQAIILPV